MATLFSFTFPSKIARFFYRKDQQNRLSLLLMWSLTVLFCVLFVSLTQAQTCSGTATLLSTTGCYPNQGQVELSGAFESCIDDQGNSFQSPTVVNQAAGSRDYTFFGHNANNQACIQTLTIVVPTVACSINFGVAASAPSGPCNNNGTISLNQISNSACTQWTANLGFGSQNLSQSTFAPGSYTVVLDNGSCQASHQITVPKSCGLVINNLNANPGGTEGTGSINFTAGGPVCGNKIFTLRKFVADVFQVQNVSPTAFGNNFYEYQTLSSGDYTVTYTDQAGVCEAVGGVTLSPPVTTCTFAVQPSGKKDVWACEKGSYTWIYTGLSVGRKLFVTYKTVVGTVATPFQNLKIEASSSGPFAIEELEAGKYCTVVTDSLTGCIDSFQVNILPYTCNYNLGPASITPGTSPDCYDGSVVFQSLGDTCKTDVLRLYKVISESPLAYEPYISYETISIVDGKKTYTLGGIPPGQFLASLDNLSGSCGSSRTFTMGAAPCNLISVLDSVHQADTCASSGSGKAYFSFNGISCGNQIYVRMLDASYQFLFTETLAYSPGTTLHKYFNLPPGNYHLEVRTSSTASICIDTLDFTIGCPCWFAVGSITTKLPTQSGDDGFIGFETFGTCGGDPMPLLMKKEGQLYVVFSTQPVSLSQNKYKFPGLIAGEYLVIATDPGSGRKDSSAVSLDPTAIPCSLRMQTISSSPVSGLNCYDGEIRVQIEGNLCGPARLALLYGVPTIGLLAIETKSVSTSGIYIFSGLPAKEDYILELQSGSGCVCKDDSFYIKIDKSVCQPLPLTNVKIQNSIPGRCLSGLSFTVHRLANICGNPDMGIRIRYQHPTEGLKRVTDVKFHLPEATSTYDFNLYDLQNGIYEYSVGVLNKDISADDDTHEYYFYSDDFECVTFSTFAINTTGCNFSVAGLATTNPSAESCANGTIKFNSSGQYCGDRKATLFLLDAGIYQPIDSVTPASGLAFEYIFTGLLPGQYKVILRDDAGLGCSDEELVTLNAGPTTLAISSVVSTPFTVNTPGTIRFTSITAACQSLLFLKKEGQNGFYDVVASQPITLGNNEFKFAGLVFGNYRIVGQVPGSNLKDSAGVNVGQICNFIISEVTVSPSNQKGCANGFISVTVTGGLAANARTFKLVNPATNALLVSYFGGDESQHTFANLSKGLYKVEVEDFAGCKVSDQFQVDSTSCSISFSTSKSDVSSFGCKDGKIDITPLDMVASCAVLKINLNLINGVGVSKVFYYSGELFPYRMDNIGPGEYKIEVTDTVNGCSYILENIFIQEPACNIHITDLQVLQPDLSACRSKGNISFAATSSLLCKPPVGFLTNIVDGVETLVQLVSEVDSRFTFINLEPGNYKVHLSAPNNDGSLCEDLISLTINPLPAACFIINSPTKINPTGINALDGTISIPVTGGFCQTKNAVLMKNGLIFSQQSSTEVSNQFNFNGLGVGNYKVRVTDIGGSCKDSVLISLIPGGCTIDINLDNLVNSSVPGSIMGRVFTTTTASGFSDVFEKLKKKSTDGNYYDSGTPTDLSSTPGTSITNNAYYSRGDYRIVVYKPGTSCKDSITFSVEGGPCSLDVALTTIDLPSNAFTPDGKVQIRVVGSIFESTTFVQFSKKNAGGLFVPFVSDIYVVPIGGGAADEIGVDLFAIPGIGYGEYRAIVKNGVCSDTAYYTISFDCTNSITQLFNSTEAPSSYGCSDGKYSANFSITGCPIAAYSGKLYKNGALIQTSVNAVGQFDFTGLSAGSYTLLVSSNDCPCSYSSSFALAQPPCNLEIVSFFTANPSNEIAANGVFGVSASGNSCGLTKGILWRFNAGSFLKKDSVSGANPFDFNFSNLSIGTYRITLTTSSGLCLKESTVTLEAATSCSISIGGTTVTPPTGIQSLDGIIRFNLSGTFTGAPLMTLKKNTGGIFTNISSQPIFEIGGTYRFENLNPGIYRVVAVSSSCRDSILVTLSIPPCDIDIILDSIVNSKIPGNITGVPYRTYSATSFAGVFEVFKKRNALGGYFEIMADAVSLASLTPPVQIGAPQLDHGTYRIIIYKPGTVCKDSIEFTILGGPCLLDVAVASTVNASFPLATDGAVTFQVAGSVYENETHYKFQKKNGLGLFELFGIVGDATSSTGFPLITETGFSPGNFKVIGYNGTCSDTSIFTITSPTFVAKPTISPGTGSFTDPKMISISTSTPGASVYYTTTGNTPVLGTGFTKLYTGPFLQNASGTIRAMAVLNGLPNSAVDVAYITISNPSVVATPTISPGTGSFSGTQIVSISCATIGASIYYTTSGNSPRLDIPNGFTKLYTGPFSVNGSSTIKAMAVKSGVANSGIATSLITITSPQATVATPVITPGTGTYAGAQTISITCATPGATVYFTTTGNSPVVGIGFTKVFTGPFTVSGFTTVRAMAVLAGSLNSAVAVAYISIIPGRLAVGDAEIQSLKLEPGVDFQVKAWPNPSSGILQVQMIGNVEQGRIEVRNLLGVLILTKENLTERTEIDLLGQPAGMYILRVFGGEKSKEIRISKQ